MSEICLTEMYRDCGISDEVLRRGEEVLKKLESRFARIVKLLEYNQLKVAEGNAQEPRGRYTFCGDDRLWI